MNPASEADDELLEPWEETMIREIESDPHLTAAAAQLVADDAAGRLTTELRYFHSPNNFAEWKRKILGEANGASSRADPKAPLVLESSLELPRRSEGTADAANARFSAAVPPPREAAPVAAPSAAAVSPPRGTATKPAPNDSPIMTGVGPDRLPPDSPVTVNGVNGKIYKVTDWLGQEVPFSEKEISERFLIMITGDVSYLAKHWPPRQSHNENFNVKAAGDALQKSLALKGFYDPSRECGPGASLGADGSLFLHTGDIIQDSTGRDHAPGNIGGVTYRRGHPILKPAKVATGLGPRVLLGGCQQFRSDLGELGVQLAAGAIAAAPVGGALAVRPNVWFVGPPGVGKSTYLEFIRDLWGGKDATVFRSDSTEAGTRAALAGRSIPVILDESEPKQDPTAVEQLMKLYRLFATGGVVGRSTANGVAITQEIRSALFASSVMPPDFSEAEESRTIVLHLEKPTSATLNLPAAEVLRQAGSDLLRIWLDRWGDWPAIFAAYRQALSRIGFSNRRADVFGTALAAAHLIQRSGVPDARDVQDILRHLRIGQLRQAAEIIHDADAAIDFLRSLSLPTGAGATYEPLPLTIARACRPIDAAPSGDDKERARYVRATEEAGMALTVHGMKVIDGALFIVSNHPAFQKLLMHTPFAGRIGRRWLFGEMLERCEGVRRGDQIWFSQRPRRGVRVPLALLPPDLPAAALPPPGTPGTARSANLQQATQPQAEGRA